MKNASSKTVWSAQQETVKTVYHEFKREQTQKVERLPTTGQMIITSLDPTTYPGPARNVSWICAVPEPSAAPDKRLLNPPRKTFRKLNQNPISWSIPRTSHQRITHHFTHQSIQMGQWRIIFNQVQRYQKIFFIMSLTKKTEWIRRKIMH